jgi:hypothetical protein
MKSLQTLIPKLREATAEEKLKWETHKWGGYTCNLGQNFIRVWEWSNPDSDATGVSVALLREKVSSDVLDAVVTDAYDSGYGETHELYLAARRSALNVDQVISEIEKALDKL